MLLDKFTPEELQKELKKRNEIDPGLSFSEYTDEELEEELKRREAPPEPIHVEEIDITRLRNEATDYIQNIYKDGHPSKDAEHYLFENIMVTFYGKDIWEWINKYNQGSG